MLNKKLKPVALHNGFYKLKKTNSKTTTNRFLIVYTVYHRDYQFVL